VPLAPFPTLLADARRQAYAVGYFEAWDSYSLDAVVKAAELERAPVVIGFGCLLVDQDWLERGGIEILGAAGRVAAERSRIPVSLLLNEAHRVEHALRAIDAGFNAVMLASSEVEPIAELARVAHDRGVAVEGELGVLPDGDARGRIDESHAVLTDPRAAVAFLRATGVDALAVSIGNVHTLEGRIASIDLGRLAAIREATDVPLVIHGGTGFPAQAVPDVIARGVAKFNVGTVLKRTFLDELGVALASSPPELSPHDVVGSHRESDLLQRATTGLVEKVRTLMRLYRSAGRAA
jgi:fructose-bisphosphate aldolase class II